jgi:hypothetical protein
LWAAARLVLDEKKVRDVVGASPAAEALEKTGEGNGKDGNGGDRIGEEDVPMPRIPGTVAQALAETRAEAREAAERLIGVSKRKVDDWMDVRLSFSPYRSLLFSFTFPPHSHTVTPKV